MYLCVCMLSHSVMSNSVTLWAVARRSPPSMGFSRQEYWSGSLCPPPGDLPDSEIKPASPAWQVDSLPLSRQGSPLQATPNGEISVCMSVAQSCLTLCDPTDGSPPGSSVHGILQARILEWVVVPFARGSCQPRDRTLVSCTAGRFFAV